MILFVKRKTSNRIKRYKIIMAFLPILLIVNYAFSITYYFGETEGKIKRDRYFIVNEIPNGYEMRFYTIQGRDTTIREFFETDKMYDVKKWHYINGSNKTNINGIRQKQLIEISGVLKGDSLKHTIKIDSLPWYQQFPFQLSKKMSGKDIKKFEFWAVGTDGPGAAKAVKFKAEPLSTNVQEIHGIKYNTRQLRIGLTSFIAHMWHCDAWFNSETGEFLMYNGKNSPFLPLTILELVSRN